MIRPQCTRRFPKADALRRSTKWFHRTSGLWESCLNATGKPAGYGLASKMYSQEAGGIQLWLEELFVLPEYRSRGLGREFIAYMESLPNVARIRLEYEKSNTRAAALYRKLGYADMPYEQLVKNIKK